MTKDPVNNLNVLSQDLLPTPQQVKRALPVINTLGAIDEDVLPDE